VQAVIGDIANLAGRQLAPTGVAAMLRSHMQATMEQAQDLQPAQRIMALNMATEMALSALQVEVQGQNDVAEFATGIFQAAKILIDRECRNPSLTPQRVAGALGCSRAGLYRAFGNQGHSVAEMIWSARVERAKSMLMSSDYLNFQVSEIAFLSGFTDHTTFTRMFKRTYGLTPSEMRQTRSCQPR
jgi:AraC-like DNA-binding protein